MQDLRVLDVARPEQSRGPGVLMNVAAETRAAYKRWAPLYPPVAHNPLMRAEQHAMLLYWPDVAGLRVLDLACGSGRYSALAADAGAADVIALDFCVPMLLQVPA